LGNGTDSKDLWEVASCLGNAALFISDVGLTAKNPTGSGSRTAKLAENLKYCLLRAYIKHGGAAMSDSVVVKSKIKELVGNYNVAGDFADALDQKVKLLVKDAVGRAEGNNRKTVMAKDL
jgi:hypothetical protein